MIITTPSDAGDGNRGGEPIKITQDAIAITQTQDGGGNNPLELQPTPGPLSKMTAGADGHVEGTTGGNGDGGGGTILNPQQVGYLETLHTGYLTSPTVTVATAIAKENTPAKQRAIATMFNQFLMEENRNIRNLNGDYKHFMALMEVLGTYMVNVAYGHGIGSAVIG